MLNFLMLRKDVGRTRSWRALRTVGSRHHPATTLFRVIKFLCNKNNIHLVNFVFHTNVFDNTRMEIDVDGMPSY